jgi:hypothetical protein
MECSFQNAQMNFFAASSPVSLMVEDHVLIHTIIIAKKGEGYQMEREKAHTLLAHQLVFASSSF